MAHRLRRFAEADAGHGAMSVFASGVTLFASFGTGVLLARHLGADGRGESAVLIALPQMVGWVFALGSSQTISYFRASRPESAADLLGTWLGLLLPLSALAILLGELLVPVVFDAQREAVRDLAVLFVPTAAVVLFNELALGFLLGAHRYAYYNVLRVLSPTAVAVVYVVLLTADELTVETAVWGFGAVSAAVTIMLVIGLVRRYGLRRPSRPLARETLWYATRAHSSLVGTLLNARLDLLIMPAILTATQTGLYSVATNVSWIVPALAGSIAVVALPKAASRPPDERVRLVLRSLHATIAIAVLLAVGLAAAGDVAVEAIFGQEFDPAVDPLLILLPGAVLYAGSMVLISGLYAQNRPFTAAAAQGTGLVVTVLGLLLFLRDSGIEAAAWVSTVAYTVVFVTALAAYRRACGFGWRAYLSSPWTDSRSTPAPSSSR